MEGFRLFSKSHLPSDVVFGGVALAIDDVTDTRFTTRRGSMGWTARLSGNVR
jgi:hypothetical protein